MFFLVLLALRNAENKPADPTVYLQEYFGKYRDPMWDELDRLREENKKIGEERLPALQKKIKELEAAAKKAKVDARIKGLFLKLEKDKTVLSIFYRIGLRGV